MSRRTRFIDACFGRPTDVTPIWLMRQAGRYQPSYRALRQKHAFFELCQTPELAAQVTVNAVTEFEVDAAIIFSDILVLLEPMGAPFELTEAGPRLSSPVRSPAEVRALRPVTPETDLAYVIKAIALTQRELDGVVPLLGFAGAPLTLAAYLVEGGHSRDFAKLKGLLFGEPRTAHLLLEKLADAVAAHLRAQVAAGCQAVQLFDTWAGILHPKDYAEFGVPYVRRILAALEDLSVPRLLFGTATGSLLELLASCGPEVVGLDWRVSLREARQRLGPDQPVQGNLDPACLFLPQPQLAHRVEEILDEAGGAPGHIFNLGHGVLPATDPEQVRFLVDTVHRASRRA